MLDESGLLCTEFDTRIHFPFIGLVRETGLKSSFEGAAVLAKPCDVPTFERSLDAFSSELKNYYSALLVKLTNAILPTTSAARFNVILDILTD